MLNKKIVERMAVFSLVGVLSMTAVTNGNFAETVKASTTEQSAVTQGSLELGIAGATATLKGYHEEILEDSSLEKENAGVVASKADSGLTKEEQRWQNRLMADVDEYVYVRKKASKKSDIVGKLRKGDLAKIVKEDKKWTKIESGNVKGYVKNEFCVKGKKALKYAKKNCETVARVETDGLRIRTKQSTKKGEVVEAVASGTKLVVNTKKKTKEGWLAVKYNHKTCFVSEEFVKVKLCTSKAITIKEEQEAIRKAKEAEEKAAAEAAAREAAQEAEQSTSATSDAQTSGSSQSSTSTQNGSSSKSSTQSSTKKSTSNSGQKKSTTSQGSSVGANADDTTLLAALIQCEAGGCSYQAQLGIGSVVCNRVKSGSFPGSIRGVIYQRGQFGPASSGKLARVLSGSISSTARRAAAAALSGTDNTNGAKYFMLASSGHKGVVIGPIVFY